MNAWCCPVPFLYLYRSGPQPENDTGHSGHNQDNLHEHGQRSAGDSRTFYQVSSTAYHRGLADKRQEYVFWLCFRLPWFLRGKTHLRWNQLLHHFLIIFFRHCLTHSTSRLSKTRAICQYSFFSQFRAELLIQKWAMILWTNWDVQKINEAPPPNPGR